MIVVVQQVQVKTGHNANTWIMVRPLDDWSNVKVEDDPAAPMLYYRLQWLKPNTYYQLEVTARNDIGWSLANAEFVFKTSAGRWLQLELGCVMLLRLESLVNVVNTVGITDTSH